MFFWGPVSCLFFYGGMYMYVFLTLCRGVLRLVIYPWIPVSSKGDQNYYNIV